MLRGSKINSLKGLENFKELENLDLFHNRNLVSLEGITEEHNKSIKEISIYTAPKLFYVNEYLSKLSNLEYLQLECKKVDSFRFLDKLMKLNLLSIHNKLNEVEDGDKTPLIEALKRTGGKIW
jgi:Leucine-rich repeat (LRR) protein